MVHITKDEIIKIAHMSNIELYDHEIDGMIKKLQAVLTYVERVQEVAIDVDEPIAKQINVLRKDVVVETASEPLLAQAPEREGNYFVVPKVLGGNS